ncbi:unnamed protein product [Cercospora beticola]|nr:unnamed protein product [Cercospora beticola]
MRAIHSLNVWVVAEHLQPHACRPLSRDWCYIPISPVPASTFAFSTHANLPLFLRIMPFGITVGALTLAFIILMLILIVQRRLLPGVLIIGAFILLVLYITGLIETAIQLFGPSGDINSKCGTYVTGQNPNDLSVNTLAWLQQNSICQSWSAVFAFWIIGAVFLVYLIVLASMVAQGGREDNY